MNKKRFFIFFSIIFLSLGTQITYLSLRPKHTIKTLDNFLHVSTLSPLCFYPNTPYLRHRNLKNADLIFSSHPALRERALGTFVNSSAVRIK